MVEKSLSLIEKVAQCHSVEEFIGSEFCCSRLWEMLTSWKVLSMAVNVTFPGGRLNKYQSTPDRMLRTDWRSNSAQVYVGGLMWAFCLFVLCARILCLYVCLCTICLSCSHEGQEEGIRYPGTRVTNCELPCGCWKSNPDALEEQPVPLIMGASLQSWIN